MNTKRTLRASASIAAEFCSPKLDPAPRTLTVEQQAKAEKLIRRISKKVEVSGWKPYVKAQ